MSAFKDQVAADLGVFVNSDEFAAVRDIDGTQISCVLDDDAAQDRTAEGVYVSETTLVLKSADMTTLPVVSQRMSIDGRLANVIHVDEMDGILTIRLHWYES